MEAPKTSPAPESQLHFLDYWRIIRIRKTVILAVFLLVVLTTTAVTLVLPEAFMSKVRVRVEKDVTDIDPLGRQNLPAPYDPYFIQTEFEKIQSTSVLYPVIEQLKLGASYAARNNDPSPYSTRETYQLLRRDLDVRQFRNTSLIEIRVYSHDKDLAAAIANKIADEYRDSRVKNKKRQAVAAIEILQKQLDLSTAGVEELQKEIDVKRTQLKIPDAVADAPGYQGSVERETVTWVAQQLTQAESEFTFWDTTVRNLKRLGKRELRETITASVPGEQLLPQLMSEFTTAEQKLASISKDLSAENPEMVRISALIAKIDQQIESRVQGILTSLEDRVESQKARVAIYKQKIDQAKVDAAQTAENYRPYFAMKRELENKQRLKDALELRVMQEKVDSELPKESIMEIVDQAEPSFRASRPNVPLNIALGVIVGLVIGVGLAFFIEYLDTSVKTIDDVERALQAPVLGVIPQNVGILLEEGSDSPHAEAYRVLRTNVLFSRKDPAANTLTVVSGGAGEGKSTTIFNLATVFAQNGQRVLVVDSDLRRPSLHKMLSVSNAKGLTNYLLRQNSLEEVIQTTKQTGLDFMPSGKLPSSSLGILNSQRMKDFVRDVKARYDFVFFDSPPIMGVSDASVLASEVDLALLVVQYRKYPQAMTVRAKQMVQKVGGNLLGVVLNNINISQDSYYYYYSGYYYDYYYSRKDDEGTPSKKNGEKKGAAPREDAAPAAADGKVEVRQKY